MPSDPMGFFNALVRLLLRSPLQRLMGGVMLISVTGRLSGRVTTTPVQFVREGDLLLVTSLRGRRWWRNLLGGAPVKVRLGGKERAGSAEAVTDAAAVREGLTAYLRAAPRSARWFAVSLDSDGRPDPCDLARAAQQRVVTRIQLEPEVR